MPCRGGESHVSVRSMDPQDPSSRRWATIRKILERPGPFCHPEFEPSPEIMERNLPMCKTLVVGAGGLGCEILKNLAMMGLKQIDIIDMDTVDLSNLNRQFLFRQKDIGQSKAKVAAEFINRKFPDCTVTHHFCRIEDKDDDFYRGFHIIVCGLDSIVARRWVNSMIVSLLEYDNGAVLPDTIMPFIDGGTEGFKGNGRVILPGHTPCIECTLDLYPPQITYPLCTIANTPRLPEHCIEYVKVVLWPKENPFNAALDGDDAQHIGWIYEKALERATQFNIPGVTYRLVQGVVKNIIPAVSSTNAVIGAFCATEMFKIATGCVLYLDNYFIFNDVDGIYTYSYKAERKENCLVCSTTPKKLTIEDPNKMKLKDLIQMFCEDESYQMKNPGITTVIDGHNKTLYMSTIKSIEERTRDNLNKTLVELGLQDGSELMVADPTSPTTMVFTLKFPVNEVEMK